MGTHSEKLLTTNYTPTQMPEGNYRQSVIPRQELENAEIQSPRRAMVGRPPGLDAMVQRHNRQSLAGGNLENRENIENLENTQNLEIINRRNRDSYEQIQNRNSNREISEIRPETANSTNSNTETDQFRAFSQQSYNPDEYVAPQRRGNVAERPNTERPNLTRPVLPSFQRKNP